MSMRSIVNSGNLNDVIGAITRLSPEDAERIALPWLQTGLRVTSRDPKATCRFGATLDTYTMLDTRETTLSPLAMRDGRGGWGAGNGHLITLGFMFHEAGHLRYSDATHAAILSTYAKSKDKALALILSNVLDDERLERWFVGQYAGTAPAINAARQYMSGSFNPRDLPGNPHPKIAVYPRDIVTKADVQRLIILAVAYDNYVGRPPTYFRVVRRAYLNVRRIVKQGLFEGPETAEEQVVATHLTQVAALIRLYKRLAKGLPDRPEPKPEPEPTDEDGDEDGDEYGEGGSGQGWGDEDEDEDGESKSGGAPESDAGDETDDGAEGGEGDEEGESEDGTGNGDSESEDESTSESGSTESESKGEGKTEPDGEGEGKADGQQGGGDEGWDDVHAPGGRGAGAGKADLDKMAEDLNERLDDIVKDPFTHDKDIMTDGTLTGTIERNPEVNPGSRYGGRQVGQADPYLTDTMREAFLSTRFSHERYASGYTRGRLRSRDACKAPVGIPNLFSQRSDNSVTRVRLTIMLDYSGSMSGLVQRSDTFFRSLADATQHISAVRIGAWTYDSNDLEALWESNEGEHVLAERLPTRRPSGGTGTATCLSMLTDEVERTALPGERQVILSITDGQPNEGAAAVRTVVEEAREQGIAVLGVNIGLTNPAPNYVEVYHRYTTEQYGEDGAVTWNAGPDAWTDLGDEVLTMVGEVLAGARAF